MGCCGQVQGDRSRQLMARQDCFRERRARGPPVLWAPLVSCAFLALGGRQGGACRPAGSDKSNTTPCRLLLRSSWKAALPQELKRKLGAVQIRTRYTFRCLARAEDRPIPIKTHRCRCKGEANDNGRRRARPLWSLSAGSRSALFLSLRQLSGGKWCERQAGSREPCLRAESASWPIPWWRSGPRGA